MRPRLFLCLGILVGAFFLVNGVLLAFQPELYLKFHDWYARGDYRAKSPEWRQQAFGIQAKITGYILAVFGAFVLVETVAKVGKSFFAS
jgi:hypothetical protein